MFFNGFSKEKLKEFDKFVVITVFKNAVNVVLTTNVDDIVKFITDSYKIIDFFQKDNVVIINVE